MRRCPGTFLQNLLVLLRQCIPCAAGSQLHLRYAAVLIGHVVPRHLVVLHGIVGRPVVFGGIDLPGLKRRVDIAVRRGLRHRAQQTDHVDHDLRILHADGLALQIVQAAHRLTGIKRAGTRVVPAQPHPPMRGKVLQKFCSDAAIQHTPHMVGIPVEIRQQQYVEPGQIVCGRRKRHTRKIYAANGKLLPHLLFRAVLAVRFDLNDHLAPGLLLHKVCKILRALCSGVPGGLVVGIGQHIVRCGLRLCATACQLQGCKAQPG